MNMTNKADFFAHLRSSKSAVFGTSLSQRQAHGLEALLDAGEGLPLAHMAHVLAECYHETGGGMYPVKETVFASHKDKNPTDAQVIARLDRAWSIGSLTWVKTPYWRDGWFGRGFIQITHKINYEKLSAIVGLDLVEMPNIALEVDIAAEIAVEGCRRGLFTGKNLVDYDVGGDYDHYSARAIVNGDTKIHGARIAGYAASFEDALTVGEWGEVTAAPIETTAAIEPKKSLLAAIIKAILGVFK